MTKPTPLELGDVEAAEDYEMTSSFKSTKLAHLAGQQRAEGRIWAKYKQREAQGYNAPLDLRQIIFNEGV